MLWVVTRPLCSPQGGVSAGAVCAAGPGGEPRLHAARGRWPAVRPQTSAPSAHLSRRLIRPAVVKPHSRPVGLTGRPFVTDLLAYKELNNVPDCIRLQSDINLIIDISNIISLLRFAH